MAAMAKFSQRFAFTLNPAKSYLTLYFLNRLVIHRQDGLKTVSVGIQILGLQ